MIHALNSYDELYALLSLLVERHFLTHHAASFTENFYGLKRERTLHVRPSTGSAHALPRAQVGAAGDIRFALRLRERDVWRNLAVLVGLPYLKRKLDEGYDIHAALQSSAILGPSFANTDALSPSPTLRQRLLWWYKWFLRRLYPSVNAAYYLALLAFQLAYLFDASRFHDPFLWLVGTRIRRMGEADHGAQAQQALDSATSPSRRPPRLGQNNSFFNPRVFVSTVYPRLLSSLRILLPTSIFALKFLEWWHASDFARQLARKAAEGLELPPPVLGVLPLPLKSGTDEKTGSAQSSVGQERRTGQESVAKELEHIRRRQKYQISAMTGLPIFTLPAVPPLADEAEASDPSVASSTDLCPICSKPIQTATASPYGYVFCYTCIHRWVEGSSDRQDRFMAGEPDGAIDDDDTTTSDGEVQGRPRSREGRWESGKGRCAVTGMRVLGGTGALRRIVV